MKTLSSIWNFLIEWSESWYQYRKSQTNSFNNYI